jgi:hypothetical protein
VTDPELTGACEWCGSPGFTPVFGVQLCVDDGVALLLAVRQARAHRAAVRIVSQEPEPGDTAALDAELRQWRS